MAELTVSVVSLEHPEWEGPASQIVVKTLEGEMGVLPGHEPVLATLAGGPIRIDPVDGDPMFFAVHGGFFSLDDNRAIILADVAETAEEINVARAQEAKSNAEKADDEDLEAIAAMRRAETRLRVVELAD